MKKSSARLSLVACLLIVCALHFLSQPTMSLSSGTVLNVVFEFEKTLELSISDPEMYIENLIPGTSDNTNEILVNVATNSETGFIMDAAVGERLRPSTRIPNIVDGQTYFSSVGLNKTVTTIPAGSWGYSIDHGATYSGLPDYRDVHPSDIFIESHTAADMSLPFLVGATAAEDQARGIYYTPITFRAVTRPTVPTIDTILYMQEFDETVYASMQTEKQYQLLDKRDGKMYFVSKLKDGNVWMTQNLDFDLYNGIELSPETSDVQRTTVMDLTPLGKNNTDSDHYYYYDNYMLDQDDYYCPRGFCYRSSDMVPLDTLEPTDKDNHYALGNRYSYMAATADYFDQCIKSELNSNENSNCGNKYNNEWNGKDAEASICPSGWTLPSNGSGQNAATLSDLGKTIGIPTNYSGSEYPYFSSPLYLVSNGYAYSYSDRFYDETNNGSSYMYYWTATNSGQYYGYVLYGYLYTNSVYNSTTGTYNYYPYSGYIYTGSSNTYSKYYLLTIRCVARAPQYVVEYYKNDGTATTPYDTWKSKKAWSGNNQVKPKSPSRAGYKFIGWGTSPKTVEPRYDPNVTIELDAYHTKLYAVWQELDENDLEEGNYSFEAVLRRAGKTTTDGYYNMQDLDGDLCQQVAVGSVTTLRDTRDGKLYKVAKDQISADGQFGTCWMHDDLRLGSKTESYTLTPENSDVTSEVEVPAIAGYTFNSENFSTTFMMDNDEYVDVNGRSLGYLYNYNLATAGYASTTHNINDWNMSETSICPKNWKLPRYSSRDLINSEKRIWDNIEPTEYTQSYYSGTSYGGKRNEILSNFLEIRSFGSRYYSNERSGDTTYRATSDYNGSTIYGSYNNNSEIRVNTSWSYERSSMVRCMIPVDYSLTDYTITYYPNYSGPDTSNFQQRSSARSDSEVVYIRINPTKRLKRPGFQLIGWSERSDATVPDYYKDDIMEMSASRTSISLYGVWRRIEGNTGGTTFDEAFEAAGKTKYGDYYAMQDITPEICDAVMDGQQGRLIDIRDNKVYWVGRLTSVYDSVHEGECWMTQNLDFEVATNSTGTQLYPETSDVTEEVKTYSDSDHNENSNYGYMDGGDYYLPDGGLRVTESLDGTQQEYLNKLVSTDELEQDDERWHYHLGSYYSWPTATITFDFASINTMYRLLDRETSICPKGWKIPRYNYNATTERSFNELSSYILSSSNSGYNNYYFMDPFYPVAAGFVYPTTDTNSFYDIMYQHRITNMGTNAYYWTPNVSSDRTPYSWYYYRSSLNSSYTDPKNRYSTSYSYSSYYMYHLFNIRCVARP